MFFVRSSYFSINVLLIRTRYEVVLETLQAWWEDRLWVGWDGFVPTVAWIKGNRVWWVIWFRTQPNPHYFFFFKIFQIWGFGMGSITLELLIFLLSSDPLLGLYAKDFTRAFLFREDLLSKFLEWLCTFEYWSFSIFVLVWVSYLSKLWFSHSYAYQMNTVNCEFRHGCRVIGLLLLYFCWQRLNWL